MLHLQHPLKVMYELGLNSLGGKWQKASIDQLKEQKEESSFA
jgi:hypothetical protein